MISRAVCPTDMPAVYVSGIRGLTRRFSDSLGTGYPYLFRK